MNLDGDTVAGLAFLAIVAVVVGGAALGAWIDYREDVEARREWEERARHGDGER